MDAIACADSPHWLSYLLSLQSCSTFPFTDIHSLSITNKPPSPVSQLPVPHLHRQPYRVDDQSGVQSEDFPFNSCRQVWRSSQSELLKTKHGVFYAWLGRYTGSFRSHNGKLSGVECGQDD
ncbi:hypothetical protein CRENBAI_000317 [Crenichthys baileyi]|uniref:Uncharacterized protein n=1 Tax=Crenichthys baileyi TaxID=28760 RepID=A0AAV9SJB7_9TELE